MEKTTELSVLIVSQSRRFSVKSIAIIIFMLFFSVAFAENAENRIVKAEVYNFGWHLVTRTSIHYETVRIAHRLKLIIPDRHGKATEFYEKLMTLPWEDKKNATRIVDTRLVIDILDSEGETLTLIASYNYIYMLNKRNNIEKRAKINDAFRNSFSPFTTPPDGTLAW